ncbi:hypothetical protein P9430_25185, partial [Citrobacter freundii]
PAVRDYSGDAAAKWRDLWAAGQGLHAVTRAEPVAAIVDELDAGYRAAVDRLCNTLIKDPA